VPDSTIATTTSRRSRVDRTSRPQDYDEFLQNALNEIQRFWRITYPASTTSRTRTCKAACGRCTRDAATCRGVAAWHAPRTGMWRATRFYCGEGDFIAYDDNELFPQIEKDIGAFALAVALAHEWGHAIQERSALQRRDGAARDAGRLLRGLVRRQPRRGNWQVHRVRGGGPGSGDQRPVQRARRAGRGERQPERARFRVRPCRRVPGRATSTARTRCKDYGNDPHATDAAARSRRKDIETGGNYPYDRTT
jgi:hypothetical protein